MRVTPGDLDDPRVRALLAEHLAGMHASSPPGSVYALDVDGLRRPEIALFTIWDGDELLGCGALKQLDANTGELKSMRTSARHLRRGAGGAMLAHLLALARQRGYARVCLETGTGDAFAPAVALYAKHGFRPGPAFGDYAATAANQFLHLDLATTIIETTAGALPLTAVELPIGDRTWSVLHSDALITRDEEQAFLRGETATKRPYWVVLWPAAIALAHAVTLRELTGARLLELGAGTGLPGIVAAARGARVVQTDRQRLVLHVCERNAACNGVTTIEHRLADWTAWTDDTRYDLILGSDVLYAPALHPHLRAIFERNLAPGGSVLLSDPFRATSMTMLEAMEADGWRVALDKWTVGVTPPPRPVGVFTLTRA